jgi:predicted RNA-binding protein with PIN domain
MADGDEIPDRAVAAALEFAVGIAAAGAKLRPALPFPAELRPFLKFTKLPAKALHDVRCALEGDPTFLYRLGAVATTDLVDEPGMLWLQRPEGWQQQLARLIDANPAVAGADAVADLRRAERRRAAAEQAALRSVAEVAALRAELERVTALQREATIEATHLRRERDGLRGEAAGHQAELRRSIDRLATANARLEAQRATAAAATQRATEAERMRDAVLADRASGQRAHSADDGAAAQALLTGAAKVAVDVAQQAHQARAMAIELGRLAGRLESLEPVAAVAPVARQNGARRPKRHTDRRPVAMPGGIYGSSAAAAEFLVRHTGIVVLVDGYNVAKLGWPRLELEEQRQRCIESCEDVARRYGAHIAVVFDGSTVAGASAPFRRLVRVTYSPEGVIADDVLRAEVEAIGSDTAVLVVTNDQAVVNDVRSMGANTLTSEQWLELARR